MIKISNGLNKTLEKLATFGYHLDVGIDASTGKCRITLNEKIGPKSYMVCWSFTDINEAIDKAKEINAGKYL